MKLSWLVIASAIGVSAKETRLGDPELENRDLKSKKTKKSKSYWRKYYEKKYAVNFGTDVGDCGESMLIEKKDINGVQMRCCDSDQNLIGPRCCGPHPWAGPDSASSCCQDADDVSDLDFFFRDTTFCPEYTMCTEPGEFLFCTQDGYEDDTKGGSGDLEEKCLQYADMEWVRIGEYIDAGGNDILVTPGCCSHSDYAKEHVTLGSKTIDQDQALGGCSVLEVDEIYKLLTLPNLKESDDEDFGRDLFARFSETRCAELLPFGPKDRFQDLTGSQQDDFNSLQADDAYLCTNCNGDKSDKWFQEVFVKRDDSVFDHWQKLFEIEWKFDAAKSLEARFKDAYTDGEAVQWIATEPATWDVATGVDPWDDPTDTLITGNWFFSENFAYDNPNPGSETREGHFTNAAEGDGHAPGFGFSSDDGLWGAGTCVDGSVDPSGPCQETDSDEETTLGNFWGVGNLNHVDSGNEAQDVGCGIVYRDGTLMFPDDPVHAIKVLMWSNRAAIEV